MEKIAILGAGAMGTALTTPLTQNGHQVRLWGTELDVDLLRVMRADLPHPRLGVRIHPQVQLCDPSDMAAALAKVDIVVLAITSDGVIAILRRAVPYLRPSQPLMMVTKGFGRNTAGCMSLLPPLLAEALPGPLQETCPIVGVGGPCKANEVAAGSPTAAIYGCQDDQALAHCQYLFQTSQYRILTTNDVVGLELAAALKNAYAIALGICDGLEQASGHPWHNLKAAIFTQSINEMMRLVQVLGGSGETISGLAGVGDLEVTALSGRNRMLGERLGRGESVIEALETMQRAEQTVEGVSAAHCAVELVTQLATEGRVAGVDYPLLQVIDSILNGTAGLVELLAAAVLPALETSAIAWRDNG